ncbi:hypothetical protein M427DRAFT_454227 [Gonapodya prolifera JEL478]|uniref:Uncharacterized protein n=1 Tax=Gonapodya prolifera (strain JEL478) TaxID=1344416 RepID=A0A139ASH4_GONPJ|nr:hypothetical protein M427DRAFT_454227 [Gonapodya prolifera JEL478]|eukprot:KXS19604.1 hypothetical protein M427DRAFT_454227 [Gonapodya prolifera JEL478]
MPEISPVADRLDSAVTLVDSADSSSPLTSNPSPHVSVPAQNVWKSRMLAARNPVNVSSTDSIPFSDSSTSPSLPLTNGTITLPDAATNDISTTTPVWAGEHFPDLGKLPQVMDDTKHFHHPTRPHHPPLLRLPSHRALPLPPTLFLPPMPPRNLNPGGPNGHLSR